MNIKKLMASDFPGIDEAKFNEWKALNIKLNREHLVVCFVALGILIIFILLFAKFPYPAGFALILMLAIYGFDLVRGKRMRRLGKELKMSDRLWAKKKGRAFIG